MSLAEDPILSRFRYALQQHYAGRVERALLYGSRARGDNRHDSDYDIAVFITDLPDRWTEMKRLGDIGTDILDEAGKFIQATPFPAGSLHDRTMLMHEIRKDGRDIL